MIRSGWGGVVLRNQTGPGCSRPESAEKLFAPAGRPLLSMVERMSSLRADSRYSR